MDSERRVHPDCVNASNPYHECVEYCFKKIAEAKAILEKQGLAEAAVGGRGYTNAKVHEKSLDDKSSSAEEEHEDQEPEVDVTQLTGRKKKLFELRHKMDQDSSEEPKPCPAAVARSGTQHVLVGLARSWSQSVDNQNEARKLNQTDVGSEKKKMEAPTETKGISKQKKIGKILDTQEKKMVKPVDSDNKSKKGIKCISYSLRYGEEMMDLQDNQRGFSNLSEGINLEKKIADSLDSLESKHVKSKSSIFLEETEQASVTRALSRPLSSCQSSVLEAKKVKISLVCPTERFNMSKIGEFGPISLKECFGGSSRIKDIGKQTGVSISTYVDFEEKVTLRLTSYEHMTTDRSPIIEAALALLPVCKKVRREIGRHEVALFLKDKHKDSLDEAEVNKLSLLGGARVQIRRVAEGNWHVEISGAKIGFNKTFRPIVSLLRTLTFQEKGTLVS